MSEQTQKGFTLVELLVAMAVLGVMMTGVLGLLMVGHQSYLVSANLVETQQSARVALDRMIREIRQAGYNPAGATLNAFTEAAATSLTVQMDMSGNGAIEPEGADGLPDSGDEEVIRYSLSGTSLQRKAGGAAAQPVIEGVQSLTLTYLDANGATIADPAANLGAIRSIVVSFTTQPERVPASYQAGKVTRSMADNVRLRSLQ